MAHKLTLEDDFTAPATVFGLISDLPDYRLCFILNQELGLHLCRTRHDKELYHKAGKIAYSEFQYHEPVRMIDWRLTSNKGGMHFSQERKAHENAAIPLVSDLKTMNYFLWYGDENQDEIDQKIITRLRGNPYIRAIQKIDTSASRHIDNLISEY